MNMPVLQLTDGKTTGDGAKTFVFKNEGHTLGNALKSVIVTYPDVQFCGYTVPHPMENTMHLRIQMHRGRAVDALKRGLEDLIAASDHLLEQFQGSVEEYKIKESSAMDTS